MQKGVISSPHDKKVKQIKKKVHPTDLRTFYPRKNCLIPLIEPRKKGYTHPCEHGYLSTFLLDLKLNTP